jgi:hypothetical protein
MRCPCVMFECEDDDFPGLCICGHTEEEHRDGHRECEAEIPDEPEEE